MRGPPPEAKPTSCQPKRCTDAPLPLAHGLTPAPPKSRNAPPFPISLTCPPSESTCRGPHRGSNSVVECNLAKVDVEGSNPFSRSAQCEQNQPVRASGSAGFFVSSTT